MRKPPLFPVDSQFSLLLLFPGRCEAGAWSVHPLPSYRGECDAEEDRSGCSIQASSGDQTGGDTFYIKTSTTVRTTEINFKIGEEFEEQTVDGRPCKSLVKWESENKMVCEQRLLKGEGPKTSWTRELTNDGELILTMTADDIVCTRVYIREC
uniref:Cellular retinoic acid binding protein 2 n=1 Tax=Bos mutus grunniens TaxID=30521 RepID=A0A8B9YLP9_BOSMU